MSDADKIAVTPRPPKPEDRPLIDAIRMRRRYRDNPSLASSYDGLVQMLAREASKA